MLGASPMISIVFWGRRLSPSLLYSSRHLQGWLLCQALASKLFQGWNSSHQPHSRDGGNHLPLAWLELNQNPLQVLLNPLPFPYNKLPFRDFPPRCDGITAPYFMIIHFCFCYHSLSCSQWHFQLDIPKKPQESWNLKFKGTNKDHRVQLLTA